MYLYHVSGALAYCALGHTVKHGTLVVFHGLL